MNEVDLVKAIEYAIAHPSEMEEQQKINYQKIVDKYTWDKVALKYVEYLKSIGVQ